MFKDLKNLLQAVKTLGEVAEKSKRGEPTLPNTLMHLLAQAKAQNRAARRDRPANFRLGTLLLPSPEMVPELAPVMGSAGLMLAAEALREAGQGEALTEWASFQKSKIRSGDWWRIASYAFAHPTRTDALLDATAVTTLGTALGHLQSPQLAFATLRLGVLVPLLAFALQAEEEAQVLSVSGSAYAMWGAFAASLLLNAHRLEPIEGEDAPTATTLVSLTLALLWRALEQEDEWLLARGSAVAAGGVAAGIAHVVALVDGQREGHATG